MVDIALNSSLTDLKSATSSFNSKNSAFSNVMGSISNYFNNRTDNNSILNSAQQNLQKEKEVPIAPILQKSVNLHEQTVKKLGSIEDEIKKLNQRLMFSGHAQPGGGSGLLGAAAGAGTMAALMAALPTILAAAAATAGVYYGAKNMINAWDNIPQVPAYKGHGNLYMGGNLVGQGSGNLHTNFRRPHHAPLKAHEQEYNPSQSMSSNLSGGNGFAIIGRDLKGIHKELENIELILRRGFGMGGGGNASGAGTFGELGQGFGVPGYGAGGYGGRRGGDAGTGAQAGQGARGGQAGQGAGTDLGSSSGSRGGNRSRSGHGGSGSNGGGNESSWKRRK